MNIGQTHRTPLAWDSEKRSEEVAEKGVALYKVVQDTEKTAGSQAEL